MKTVIRFVSAAGICFLFTLSLPAPAAETVTAPNPVGFWVSVDFVRHIEDFRPGKKTSQGELHLKNIKFKPDGKTSRSFTWKDTWLLHEDGKTKAQFYIKTIDGTDYLFLPWLSGDVTQRGMEPWFYVLQKRPSQTPPSDQMQSQSSEEFRTISPVGYWISVDFVDDIEDFQPGEQTSLRALYLKDIEFLPNGRTSLSFTWQGNWILEKKTKYQFYIKTIDGTDYLFLPWLSGDVTLRGMKPKFYVLKKDIRSIASDEQPKTQRGFRQVTPVSSLTLYDDVRWKDLTQIDIRQIAGVIGTLDFNKDTLWPDPNKLPRAKRPDKILKDAMNPGLGIHKLHAQGITGKGVHVGIIDQPLYLNHPEYNGKIVKYFDTGCQSESSMHGPGVTSLLVGTQCGTAPDARVYYAAVPSWKKDSAYFARALDWMLEQNANLPASEKIRVVSVSAAPSGQGSPFDTNTQMWDQALTRAQAAGVLVLDCTTEHGIIGPCWLNSVSPETPAKCTPGFPGRPWQGKPQNKVLAPTCPRTTAEQYEQDQFGWQYNGRGGLSWAIPYTAGVLAMGWQVNPDLTAEQMRELLFETAHTNEKGFKIIHPIQLILSVKHPKKP